MVAAPESAIGIRHRIATTLMAILTAIALVVAGVLIVMIANLVDIRRDLVLLRDNALPRLVKISQLSQEAAATISIAPALSATPSRFAFETLLSRIVDKQASQAALIAELRALVDDDQTTAALRRSNDDLMDNLDRLTEAVRQQIDLRTRLDRHVETVRAFAREAANGAGAPDGTRVAAQAVLAMLLDPNGARFARNWSTAEASLAWVDAPAPSAGGARRNDAPAGGVRQALATYWAESREAIHDDKQEALANDFQIKALAEETALLSNRLLIGASNAFARSRSDIETRMAGADRTIRLTALSLGVVLLAFALGNILIWLVLQRRVLHRLDGVRRALSAFADRRERPPTDTRNDEIGAISRSLEGYMNVIESREKELSDRNREIERISGQLSKYLAPQIYNLIFTGQRGAEVASVRKKLTVFFSDIAGFTEATDRLESEELTQMLNRYLTEMSAIALQHGATIDKYVGDAILIFFGDPESRGVREDALACVRMAIAMRAKMRELQDLWHDAGIDRPLKVRTGIHTGFCTVGTFGSEDRMDYTIIGGAVNLAARLESIAEPGEILITYETYAQIRDAIDCEEHAEVAMRGLAYPIATYRVLEQAPGRRAEAAPVHEARGRFRLDLDAACLTENDRREITAVLRRALDLVKPSGR